MRKTACLLAALIAATALSPVAEACTRIVYQSGKGDIIVGRSMDWMNDTDTDLWAFPAGMARDGGAGDGSIAWTSKHGSVISSFYGIATVDGMNSAGLAGNVLYLAESDYGDYRTSGKKLLSVGAWLQYVLDNFATVAEAVEALSAEPFAIVAPVMPDGKAATGHLAITDAGGDSAVFEYIGGKLKIHHGKQYTVMTNSPPFDQQLAISTYWSTVGGLNFLPGTIRASDRFARMDWMLNATPKVDDPALATASVMSLMRAISVPLGIKDPERPNIASTLWRTVADTAAKRYFYENALSPSVFWVDLDKLDLSPAGKTLKLDLQAQPILSGEVSASFAPAEPFKFIAPAN
jgi:choloylglycine hydrolase